jgi:hypothetical protein
VRDKGLFVWYYPGNIGEYVLFCGFGGKVSSNLRIKSRMCLVLRVWGLNFDFAT